MSPFSANPLTFIFSALVFGAAIAYVVIDRAGLDVRTREAIVLKKQFNKSGKSYYTNIVDGQSIVQSRETPETYVVVLAVGNESTSALVTRVQYEALCPNDKVQVRVRRRRLSGRLDVLSVAR